MPTPSDPLPTSVELAQAILAARIQPGDCVVDATAGNGHDTLFLARLVGPGGRVFAFDVQEAAIASTRDRLRGGNVEGWCELIHAGHELMAERLPAEMEGVLAGVMFNLGWLPGHDKACITHPESTLKAISTALAWLRPTGILSVVVYPGHEGGAAEAAMVADWASVLPSYTHEVRHYRPANRAGRSPESWLIRVR
jgi:predicted methyltransferase